MKRKRIARLTFSIVASPDLHHAQVPPLMLIG